MPKFQTRARAVDMLGRQQIAGVPNAVNEIFKNAHDAYANRVIADYFLKDDLLMIWDDGFGMTYDDFLNRWLTLGTESKLDSEVGIAIPSRPKRVNVDRAITGEKGIGRLAIATIGPQVLLFTHAEREDKKYNTVAAFINWSMFELPGVNLEDIDIPVIELKTGEVPNWEYVEILIEEVRKNLNRLVKEQKVDSRFIERIEHELTLFPKIDPGMLWKRTGAPTLTNSSYGTHFFVSPTDQILRSDAKNAIIPTLSDVPELQRLLLGFTNTMISNHPIIQTGFRVWNTNEAVTDDIISQDKFFTANEFEIADHKIVGEFTETGQFIGDIYVYGKLVAKDYVLPSRAQNITCGPFELRWAYVQAQRSHSMIKPLDYNILDEKVKSIGGLYIYRDGIRMLPYGGPEYDFLEFETERTKKLTGSFSYRRMFGTIMLSKERNKRLEEKAGREGFRENKAWRDFKDVLRYFFRHVSLEFFNKGGANSETYFTTREELDNQYKAIRRQRDRQSKKELSAFETRLQTNFALLDNGKKTAEVSKILEEHSRTNDRERATSAVKSLEALREVRVSLILDRPVGYGLTPELTNEWLGYTQEVAAFESNVIQPSIEQIVRDLNLGSSPNASNIENTIFESASQRFIEFENTLNDKLKSFIDDTEKMQNLVSRRVKEITNKKQSFTHFNSANGDTEAVLMEFNQWRAEIDITQQAILRSLDALIQQVKEIDLREDSQTTASESLASLETELFALRDRLNSDIELTQIGMAVEIISHEFENSVTGIWNNLDRLSNWARANPAMIDLYQQLRGGFEHIDNYIAVLSPLRRKRRRGQSEIKGSYLYESLRKMFEERMKTTATWFEVTPSFLSLRFDGYMSTIYPVLINLVDNAVFWVQQPNTNNQGRRIELDADNSRILVSDTGPGIPERDRNSIFRMGFSRRPDGRGYGLYIAREVLQRDGYELNLINPKSEFKTTFEILITPNISK